VARSERRRENAERLRVFLSGSIDIVPFEEEDAVAAGDLRAPLETAGTPNGPYDLLIAAQTLRSRTTLVTANVSRGSSRLAGLDGRSLKRGRSRSLKSRGHAARCWYGGRR
jgi:tRNA(fMet)-specific endonuclease VapC